MRLAVRVEWPTGRPRMPAECGDTSQGLLPTQLSRARFDSVPGPLVGTVSGVPVDTVSRAPVGTVPTRQPRPACSNAGTNAYRVGPLASQQHDDIISIVESNVIGVMLGESKQHTRVGACFLAGRRC